MESNLSDKIALWVSGLLTAVNQKLELKYFLPVLLAVLTGLLFLFLRQRRTIRTSSLQTEVIDRILTSFKPEKGLEKNLADFLEMLVPLVEAEVYFFYLFDLKSNNYVLKAVRYKDQESSQITPNYAGLVPYKKENYSPPLNLPSQQPDKPGLLKQGEVPMLVVPVQGGAGLIQIGPVHGVSKRTMLMMNYLHEKLQPALEMIVKIEEMKNQVESVTASTQAIRSLTKSTLDLDGSLSALMGLSIKIVDAAGGCFLFKDQNRSEAAVVSGLEKETVELLRQDQETHHMLHKLVENEEFVMLSRERAEYFKIPSYFAALGVEMLFLIKIYGNTTYGTAVFWYPKNQAVEQHRLATLQMLTKRMGDALDRQLKFKEMSAEYLDMLKMIVTAVDNLEPYTVGHSELVSRYAGIICSEVKLSKKDTREIMLAGYLHDIGMMGLSGDILFKSGKYTEIEHSTMKLHAEVGAAIIESTISNNTVASYVRHHHERWDGYGYPAGLKEKEIPPGARIISVADTFNAKLTARRNREPVTFEQAIADLRAAAGTQLDPELTGMLVDWFRKKQADPLRQGRALGACWEMRCCPATISKLCPAYKRTDLNCWETEGTNCPAHGNTCPTCVVYTEFVYRTGKTLAKR